MKTWMALGIAVALSSVATTGHAQGTITDGPAALEWGPVSPVTAADGAFTAVQLDGVLQTYQIWFFVRGAGLAAERPLPTPDTQSYVGNVATLGWTNFLGTGLAGELVYTLTSTGPGTATLSASFEVTNPSASSIAIELFAYVDLDLAGSDIGDSADLVSGFIDVMDGTTSVRISGIGSVPDAYQVGPYPTFLRSLQDATPTNLDGSGLPFGPGDFAAAVQWGVAVPASGSLTRGLAFAFTGPVPPAVCGNGMVETGETCDDGFADACGTCNADCTGAGAGATCGDGTVCPELESCDDGFTDACGSCNADCTAAGSGSTCGDGMLCDETEVCDDGFTDACGTCNADCTAAGAGATCGDGMVCDETEVCDDGFADACGTCNADCTAAGAGATCGDGMVCAEVETCDDGFTDACGTCNADCTAAGTAATCGDGMVCAETEACDDGNTTDGDGCSMTCEIEVPMDAGVPDAGPMDTDAGMMGTDAGMMGTDAGMMGTDAGMMGTDAGMMGTDGGVPMGTDAGPSSPSDGGCSCRATRRSHGAPAGALLGLLVVGFAFVRRRRR